MLLVRTPKPLFFDQGLVLFWGELPVEPEGEAGGDLSETLSDIGAFGVIARPACTLPKM